MAKNSTKFGLVDLSSDLPPKERHLVVKSDTTSGQLDICQPLGQADPCQMYPPA